MQPGWVTLGNGAAIGSKSAADLAARERSNYVVVGSRHVTWWFGWIEHALGMLLLTPMLLRPGGRGHEALSTGQQLELLVLAGATVGLSLAVFTAMGDPHMFSPMSYALFPLLLWTVLRFGPRQAAAMLLLIALVAAWGTAGGNGPFALAGPEASAGSLYLYLSVATVATLALTSSIAERRRTDDVLRGIAHATAPLAGEALLRELMRHMAGAFRLECAFIAECVNQPVTRMRVLACWRGSGFAPSREYDLAGRPCEEAVIGRRVSCILDQLERRYPGERGMDAQGYLGVPIMDSDGNRVIGHFAFLSKGPMDESIQASPLFQILTSRAAAELRRQRAEDQARQHLQQLAQVSRALALGEMGSAIAHELNQPLASVVTYAHVCRRLLDAGHGEQEVKRAMQRIADQAERAGQILRRLRGFLATGAAAAAPADLGALTHEIIDLAQPEARQRRVELQVDLQPGLPPVKVDGIQVQQVILNLVRNAIEATAASDTPHRWVKLVAKRSQDGVEVAVADNGPGVPPALADRVFEPFFTTKAEGTGIGLSISRSIAEAHGGRLSLAKVGAGGACFTFWLPRLGGRDAG